MAPSTRIEEVKSQIAEHERQLLDLRRELNLITEHTSALDVTCDTLEDSNPSSPTTSKEWRWPLSAEEYIRYGRQMILPEIGLQGQLRLKSASVLIVGLGGLGCPAASYLAGAGVGRLGLMDGDTVELSNLHRQILHTTKRVGKLKVESARDNLEALNPLVECTFHSSHLTSENATETFAPYDLILDCTDHPTSRYLISDAAVLAGKPLISASALRTDGQLLILNHPPTPPPDQRLEKATESGPCYRCIFPVPPPADSVLSCGEGGILGPVVGVMGVLMALEALKLLTLNASGSAAASSAPATGESREHSMFVFSALSSPPFRSVRLKGRRVGCIACSGKASITAEALKSGKIDYTAFCGVQNPILILGECDRVSAKEYSLLQQGDHVLLDVRDRTQFGLCSLEGSVNLPWTSLQGIRELATSTDVNGRRCTHNSFSTFEENPLLALPKELDGNKDIYTICRFGNDSQLAVQKLRELGFGENGRRICDIRGGFSAWKRGIDTDWPEY